MADHDAEIRPATHALEALIRESVSRTRQDSPANPDALLFLGHRHRAFPAVLVQDPVLEPVDKLVWMVICHSAASVADSAIFPSYEDIARLANVSSTATVARAMLILRATRWLSLYARRRDASGRFGGNVYALHPEPLPLADTLYLDPGYPKFLRDSARHHHARVRHVATTLSTSVDEVIGLEDGRVPTNLVERRLEPIQRTPQNKTRRYFSFSAAVVSNLSNTRAELGGRDHKPLSEAAMQDLQNLKSVHPQNLKSVPGRRSSSRSSKNRNENKSKDKKTTTTSSVRKEPPAREAAVEIANLIFPKRLNDDQRSLAANYLAEIPDGQRQPVLDELEGRLRAERRGAKPLYDELRYLQRLCVAVNRGRFQPNLGLKVRGERDRRRRELARQQAEDAAQKRQRSARSTRRIGGSELAEIRKKLGMPPTSPPTED